MSGLHCTIPNGTSAPGNVSIGPPAGVPDVPTNVSTSVVGARNDAAPAIAGTHETQQANDESRACALRALYVMPPRPAFLSRGAEPF